MKLHVYNDIGGTVGEIQMSVQEVKIPPYVTFLDHWLYELRRIYDVVDSNNPLDWLTEKKD